jgi:hypothetical protein
MAAVKKGGEGFWVVVVERGERRYTEKAQGSENATAVMSWIVSREVGASFHFFGTIVVPVTLASLSISPTIASGGTGSLTSSRDISYLFRLARGERQAVEQYFCPSSATIPPNQEAHDRCQHNQNKPPGSL